MRRLLLILIIALLPVRGWASDAMSVSSAVQQLNTTEFVASNAIQTRARDVFYVHLEAKLVSSVPWECPVAAQYGSSAEQSQSGNGITPQTLLKPLCPGCGSCQLCMAFVTGVNLPVIGVITATYPVPVPRSSGFSSATLPPGFKPPIA